MHLVRLRSISATITLCVALSACGDDGPSLPGLDDDGSDDAGDDAADTGSGEIGPVARIRLINLVPGQSFDVWGADVDHDPVLIASGIAPESVSEYLDAPLNSFTMHPELVLMPAGEAPENVATWEVDNGMGPDRANVIVTELDGAGQQATLVLSSEGANVGYEQLDETEIMTGDPGAVSLHVGYRLFDLEGPTVAAFGIVGEPCLFTGSSGIPQPWSIPPGTFDVGVYDLQTVSECTTPLVTASITAAADEHVIAIMYHVGDEIALLTAPIPL